MAGASAYNWIKANKTLVERLLLDDDVSSLAGGGSMTLAGSEGAFDLTLANTNGSFLPANIDGPLTDTTAIQCPNNYSVYDNARNRASVAYNATPSGGSWGVGCWVKPLTNFKSAFGNLGCIWSAGGTSTSNTKILRWHDYQEGDPSFRVRANAGAGTIFAAKQTSPPSGGVWTWYYCQYILAGASSEIKLYQNGELVTTTTVALSNYGNWSGTEVALWGQNVASGGQEGFDGAIWDWFVLNDDLDATEVASLYDLYLASGGGSKHAWLVRHPARRRRKVASNAD